MFWRLPGGTAEHAAMLNKICGRICSLYRGPFTSTMQRWTSSYSCRCKIYYKLNAQLCMHLTASKLQLSGFVCRSAKYPIGQGYTYSTSTLIDCIHSRPRKLVWLLVVDRVSCLVPLASTRMSSVLDEGPFSASELAARPTRVTDSIGSISMPEARNWRGDTTSTVASALKSSLFLATFCRHEHVLWELLKLIASDWENAYGLKAPRLSYRWSLASRSRRTRVWLEVK
jgi:hypothetical protein